MERSELWSGLNCQSLVRSMDWIGSAKRAEKLLSELGSEHELDWEAPGATGEGDCSELLELGQGAYVGLGVGCDLEGIANEKR